MFDTLMSLMENEPIYFAKAKNSDVVTIKPILLDINIICIIRNNKDLLNFERMVAQLSEYKGYTRKEDDTVKVVLQF